MTLSPYPEEVSKAIDKALEQKGGTIVVHNEDQAVAAKQELEQKIAAREGGVPVVNFVVDTRQQIGMLLIAPNYESTNVRSLLQIVRGMQEDEMMYWLNECSRKDDYSVKEGMPEFVKELCAGINQKAFTDAELWILRTYFGY